MPGTNLLQTLTMPCNMTLTQSYESQRDLPMSMAYRRGTTLVAQRSYSYDSLGRPLTRSTARNGQTVNDSFVHNSRSELASATVNGASYGYGYDNIGNLRMAMEASDYTLYEANALNQYTSIQENEEAAFTPTFDTDGNQTLVKTTTGIWTVAYDAENRPVSFTNAESNTVIECSYDYMGRCATKKLTINGNITLHQCFIYRGYQQIACCDLTRSNHPCLWLITWDPSQPVATRPLAIQKDGTWYTYGWDLTKNICEVYGQHGYIRTACTYSPYGQVASSGDVEQPIQWSSEFNDTELALIYYNYRHYNPVDGRWMGRDFDQERKDLNDYLFAKNSPSYFTDVKGMWVIPVIIFIAGAVVGAYAGIFIENECHVAGEISEKEVRQKCTRTCKYSSMWACCKNTEKSRVRKAKYICRQTITGKKLKFYKWLDNKKPNPAECVGKNCIDKGVKCSIS